MPRVVTVCGRRSLLLPLIRLALNRRKECCCCWCVLHPRKRPPLTPSLVTPAPHTTAQLQQRLTLLSSPLESTDSRRLPQNHRQSVAANGSLVVADVERTDAGDYACVVEGATDDGRPAVASSRVVRVSVVDAPAVEGFVLPASLEEGVRWHSLCSVTRGDPPVSVEWRKDGRLIDGDSSSSSRNSISDGEAASGIRVVHVTPYSSTLIFESIRGEDRGNYTCSAANRAGNASVTQQLQVHVPPKWLLQPSDATVARGSSLRFDCQATDDAFPAASVSWSRADGQSSFPSSLLSSLSSLFFLFLFL